MKNNNRKVSIIQDVDGQKTVFIHDVMFKGRKKVDWNYVKNYLKEYIGEFYSVIEYNDKIFIGRDLPDEYSGSNYTRKLVKAISNAKANSIIGIPELIGIAKNRTHKENFKEKHNVRAKNGWYKYETRFALPSYSSNGELDHYNVWKASLLVNETASGKKYLYDIVDIKKEAGHPR